MSPWTFLVWFAVTVVYLLFWAGLWFLARLEGCGLPPWLLPALAAGLPLLCLLLYGMGWVVRRMLGGRRATPPTEQYRKNWQKMAQVLGSSRRPVFIAMGEEDQVRRRLWLGRAGCRYLLDDASGLGFVELPNCLWLDIPAAFLAIPNQFANFPDSAPVATGAWEELVRFLPSLPGKVRGVLLLADPGVAAAMPEAATRWLAHKLQYLFARCRPQPPAIWLAATRLEAMPGGKTLTEALENGRGPALGDAGLSSPLGALAVVAEGGAGGFNQAALRACVAALRDNLDKSLSGCDAVSQDNAPARGLLLLRQGLDETASRLAWLVDMLGEYDWINRTALAGFFLLGVDGTTGGMAFGGKLLDSVIPDRARERRAARGSWAPGLILAAVAFLCGGGLWYAYRQADTLVDELPVALLERAPGGGFGGPPPIERYAQARRRLDGLEAIAAGPAGIFRPVRTGLAGVEALFQKNLASWLPDPDNPFAVEPWLDGLFAWAERESGSRPMEFKTPTGATLAQLPGGYSTRSRRFAFTLLDDWSRILDEKGRGILDTVRSRYDARLYQAWQQGGEALEVNQEILAQRDLASARDVLAANAGIVFVEKAAAELAFAENDAEIPPWVAAVLRWRQIMAASDVPSWGGSGVTAASLPVLADATETIWRADSPPAKLDRLRQASLAWNAYRACLDGLFPATQSAGELRKQADELFLGHAPDTGLQGLSAAWQQVQDSLALADPVFMREDAGNAFQLPGTAVDLFYSAAIRAACQALEKDWAALVLGPLYPLSRNAVEGALYVDEDPVGKYLSAAALPYLDLERGRYIAAEALGRAFPWREEFIRWVNQWTVASMASQRDYPLRIRILPVTVNSTALKYPRGITLAVECKDKPQKVTVYNFEDSVYFSWNPRHCGSVRLAIHFDEMDLMREFPGPMGVMEFIDSLQWGSLRLDPLDFPANAARLAQCGVTEIVANFAIEDPEGLREVGRTPGPPPERVTQSLESENTNSSPKICEL